MQHPMRTPVKAQISLQMIPAGGNVAMSDEKTKLAWYKYLSRVFWKSGFYRALNLVHQQLQALKMKNPEDQTSWEKTMAKLGKRLTIANTMMITPRIDDPIVAETIQVLVSQGYHQARQLFKGKVGKIVPGQTTSEDFKTLVVALQMIKFDAIHNRPKVPLWEDFWRINTDQKIIAYKWVKELARQPEIAARQGLPKPASLRARMLLILGQPVETIIKRPEITSDPLESHLLQGYAFLQKRDYCGAIEQFEEALNTPEGQQGEAKEQITAKKESWKQKCHDAKIKHTFTAFCQIGPGTEFPIAEATRRTPFDPTVLNHERLYWSSIYVDGCQLAEKSLKAIKSAVGMKVNETIVKTRLDHMDKMLAECKNKNVPDPFSTLTGQQVQASLEVSIPEKAFEVATLNKDKKLQFACLLFQFPRYAYAPCMGGTLVSGNLEEDLSILMLADMVRKKQGLPFCPQTDPKCHYQQLQAYYVNGQYEDAKRMATMIPPTCPFCKPTHMFMACTEMCSGVDSPAKRKSAGDHAGKLKDGSKDQPNLKILESLAKEPEVIKKEDTKPDPLKNQMDSIKQDHQDEILQQQQRPSKPKTTPPKKESVPPVPMPPVQPKGVEKGACKGRPVPSPYCCSPCGCGSSPSPKPSPTSCKETNMVLQQKLQEMLDAVKKADCMKGKKQSVKSPKSSEEKPNTLEPKAAKEEESVEE